MKKWIAFLSAILLTLSCAMAESSDTAHTEILSFDDNPTTGYSWVGFVLGGEAVQLDGAEGTYIPDDQTGMLCGAGGQTQYVVTAVKPGRSIITFDYRRSWENTSLTQKGFQFIQRTLDRHGTAGQDCSNGCDREADKQDSIFVLLPFG